MNQNSAADRDALLGTAEEANLFSRIRNYAVSLSFNRIAVSLSDSSLASSGSSSTDDFVPSEPYPNGDGGRHHRSKSAAIVRRQTITRGERPMLLNRRNSSLIPILDSPQREPHFLLDSFDCAWWSKGGMLQGRLYLCHAFALFNARQYGRLVARLRIDYLAIESISRKRHPNVTFLTDTIQVKLLNQLEDVLIFCNFQKPQRAINALQEAFHQSCSLSMNSKKAIDPKQPTEDDNLQFNLVYDQVHYGLAPLQIIRGICGMNQDERVLPGMSVPNHGSIVEANPDVMRLDYPDLKIHAKRVFWDSRVTIESTNEELSDDLLARLKEVQGEKDPEPTIREVLSAHMRLFILAFVLPGLKRHMWLWRNCKIIITTASVLFSISILIFKWYAKRNAPDVRLARNLSKIRARLIEKIK